MGLRTSRKLLVATLLGVSASLAADFILLDRENLHPVLWYSDVPAFWAAFGVSWCAAIILGSKWLGHAFLMRKRDPYTDEQPPAAEGDASRR